MHVPGWHEFTRELQEQGGLQVAGIIQEQHPDRARLFMQWKRMSWPVLVDSLNLLDVGAVPITLAIDEHGIIRAVNPRKESLLESFVEKTFEAPGAASKPPESPRLSRLEAAARRGEAGARLAYADGLFLWGGVRRLDEAIGIYEQLLRDAAEDARALFRLGTVYRARYDSGGRRPEDFSKAVAHWTRALEIDPNNYIWRRRIQQYGPRLEKPYPFYDWVETARTEIASRGETPVPLGVEPGGAEIAQPARTFETATGSRENPDPRGRITRDRGEFVLVEHAVVPPAVAPGGTVRIHVVLRTNPAIKAHWNNEVGDLVFWVDPPEGWTVSERRLTAPRAREAVSLEPRSIEFEVRAPGAPGPRPAVIRAYALYYVCEDVMGACLYRRQDLAIPIPLEP